jgi:methylase of polypeptide subunit release factors
MAPRSPFTTIVTEGGLLPSDLLSRLAQQPDSVTGTRPDDYHLASGRRLRDAINRSWTELQGAWEAFQAELVKVPTGERATTVTRERWLLPLFAELGFGRLPKATTITVDGREYPVSHIWGTVPIHLLGADVELDRRTRGVAGAATAAPHSMVQELLNRSDDHLWAIVTNGRRLRLLRDNTSLTRASYVEFDLEAMFPGQVFTDFAVLWLVCHQSRFEADPPELCWLERWLADVRQQGVRALDTLRSGFEKAITRLGRGFLAHPANTNLRERLRRGDLSKEEYQRQVLRLVYRLVFLLVAEDRDLLHPPAATDIQRQLYARYYSVGRIREHSRRHLGGRHGDLWESLKPVFAALDQNGMPQAGLAALGSFLWSPEACPDLIAARLANADLLSALRHLSYTERDRTLRRVDFVNLGPEELGSVYESLLDLHPRVEPDAARYELVAVGGSERKSSGSYYTPTSLITALLDAALDPLLDQAEQAVEPTAAILALTVLDPACGSGHFLTAAARRIAARLAAVETGELSPTPDAVRHALRRVTAHCVFGIDRNPMAVELAKVNLWLDAVDPGLPLTFLDHHIVCGDALLGATPALIDEGVPDEAFTAIEGDDKATATARRRTNALRRSQRAQGMLAVGHSAVAIAASLGQAIRSIDTEDDTSVDGIQRKQRRWAVLQANPERVNAILTADTWCAAFLARKTPDQPAINDETLRAIALDAIEDPRAVELIEDLAAHYRLFHPHLGFPDVFAGDSALSGGFDLVLGNPPWNTLSPDHKEFFSTYEPGIRFAPKEEQQQIIDELLRNDEIAAAWNEHRRDLFASVHFMKNSGRYLLFAPGNLGKGDFNVYRMFVETALAFTRPGGYVAQIVPSGLYGGANAMAIRQELFEHWELTHVLGFINTSGEWFPTVHRDMSFSVYAARKGGHTEMFNVAFGLASAADLKRAMAGEMSLISVAAVREQSPQSLAIPEVADAADAALATRLATRWPPFGDSGTGGPYRHYQREIDLGTDRDLFGDYAEGLPLYEGRMVGQFDHRAKAYRSGRGRAAVWEDLDFGSPEKAIVPQWRLPERNIPNKVGDRVWRYRVGWCDVTGARNERSLVAALIPPGVICGHSLPTFIFSPPDEWAYMLWLAVANSFVMDYLVRKRVTLHVALAILDGLPFPRLPVDDPTMTRLGKLALRLTCTGPEMTPYWNAMAAHGWGDPVPEGATPPGYNDPKKRPAARAEIDAIVGRDLFGLTRVELSAILDTFPVLRRRESNRKAYGEFRTKRLILERYDSMTQGSEGD